MMKASSPSDLPRSPSNKNRIPEGHHRKSLTRNQIGSKTISSLTRNIDIDSQVAQIRRLGLASLLVGLIMATICGCMIFNRTQAQLLLSTNYTNCIKVGSNTPCHTYIDSQMSDDRPVDRPCKCRLNFTLDNDVQTDRVYIYYGLNYFYQNYRFLVHSMSYRQLGGDMDSRYTPKSCLTKENKTTIPCGQIANIMFDDDFEAAHSSSSALSLDRKNIVIDGIRGFIFKNPNNFNANDFRKPARWTKNLYSLGEQSNNGLEYGPLIVWMTVSTFNCFRKLYAIVNPINNKL